MDECTLKISYEDFLQWGDTTDPETLISAAFLDPTKTYVKYAVFLGNTDSGKQLADLLGRGGFWFIPAERAYIMDPKILPSVIKYDFPKVEDPDTPDFYLNNGFVRMSPVRAATDEMQNTLTSDS